MGCYLPLRAWQTVENKVVLGNKAPQIESKPLALPCGKCTGCRTTNARAWALRNHLENQQHRHAVFTTLTYDDDRLPPTLEKRHLTLWLKRVRKAMGPARPIRFFASGEYGEQNGRPHYHALLYGAAESDAKRIDSAWNMGHTKTVPISPAAIAYVAGYTAKKLGDTERATSEQVDPETGEVYRWQPPFLQMSRRPGIGGEARKFTESWRSFAIHNGARLAVPRFLHAAWEATATEADKEKLLEEVQTRQKLRPITLQQLDAEEQIQRTRQALKAARRKI